MGPMIWAWCDFGEGRKESGQVWPTATWRLNSCRGVGGTVFNYENGYVR